MFLLFSLTGVDLRGWGELCAVVVELTDVSIRGGFERVGGGLCAAVAELTDVSLAGKEGATNGTII